MRAAAAAAPLLALALVAGPARGADEPAAPADARARVAAAQEQARKDPFALAKQLTALGASKAKDADREFLQQYALAEHSRPLRLVALEALSRLDRKQAAAWFRGQADGKDQLRTLVAVEALGHLGTKDDAPAAIELMKSADELVAVEASRTVARLGTPAHVDRIVEVGLAHPSQHVTDHAAWAVQDILRKPKPAIAEFQKWVGKSGDARAVRASATVALLEDDVAPPHEWKDTLRAARDLVVAAPARVQIETKSEEYRRNVEASLEWMRKNLPAAELLVRAAARRIDVPGKQADSQVDLREDVVQVPLTWAVQPPHKIAYHVFLMASVLWNDQVGEPAQGHRGWETGLCDIYELCVIAKLFDAGPGGLSRTKFVADRLERKPWGSL